MDMYAIGYVRTGTHEAEQLGSAAWVFCLFVFFVRSFFVKKRALPGPGPGPD